jgi:hypothetical protein
MAMASIYEYDEEIRSDSEFLPGSPKFIVPGNRGRLLDARRTPIKIERYVPESGLVHLRIEKFEDAGNVWQVPAEQITRYQFELNSQTLDELQAAEIQAAMRKFSGRLQIEPEGTVREATEREIAAKSIEAATWLKANSKFLESGAKLDLLARTGPTPLRKDFEAYLEEFDLRKMDAELAIQWACQNGGEAVRLLQIRMAEIGLIRYDSTIIRDERLRDRLGDLRTYVLHRLAFIRALFETLSIDALTLYRGMSSERGWRRLRKCWSSWTPVLHVAQCHADYESYGQHRGASNDSYLVKRTFPIAKLFMTYFETEGLNKQWKETEVIVMHDDDDRMLF